MKLLKKEQEKLAKMEISHKWTTPENSIKIKVLFLTHLFQEERPLNSQLEVILSLNAGKQLS